MSQFKMYYNKNTILESNIEKLEGTINSDKKRYN